MTSGDFRLFERFLTRFPAKFKDTRDDFGEKVYLRNASASGMKFSTKERMSLHDHVNLEVELPDGMAPMNIRGTVVWVKGQDYNIWDAGITLHNVDLMHMARLYKFTLFA